MKKTTPKIDIIDDVLSYGAKKGVMHLNTVNKKLTGNKFVLDKSNEKEVINFGSCSYLGLEFDERLRRGAIDAITNYGTQFSSSRAYMSPVYYEELEALFNKIFNAYTVVTPTSTLGHIGAIPVLVDDKDAIILDHQVHNSVHTAVNLVKAKGVYTELIRHNRMDILEERIKELRQKYNRIWYMADGVYSMYGDVTPIAEVYELMSRYPELYYYVDDAHGMSCFGERGQGYALGQKPIHEKMVMITSLAKAFATGGGVAVFPNKETARKFRTCGSTVVTSGPMQPSGLGAAIASAHIHLTPELAKMQEQLYENIKYTNLAIKKSSLPLISESKTPIFFVGASLPKIGYSIIDRMLHEGYYVNAGIFPGVPIKNTGIRFTITRLHTFKQIDDMVSALAYHHGEVLKEENFPISKIYQAFKMKEPIEQKAEELIMKEEKRSTLSMRTFESIAEIDKHEWDELLGDRGSFNWEGMKFLEESFKGNDKPENNWNFDYIIVKDDKGKTVLATFLTTTIWKDDMMAPEGVSMQLEIRRKAMKDPYYLTSKIVSMGSLLTEGEHLYIDRTSTHWREAMGILLERMAQLQEKYNAASTLLRDLKQDDEEMDSYLMDNGYFKVSMPDNHIVDSLTWSSNEEFVNSLSTRARKNVRQEVIRHENSYELKIVDKADEGEVKHWYALYQNVKAKSLLLNTFDLPLNLFNNMANNPNWEVMELYLKPEHDTRGERKPVVVVFSYVAETKYTPMIIGIDYEYQAQYKCYKQALYQLIKRGKALGKKAINLGFSASVEKQKYGAKVIETVAYMQARDNFALEAVANMNVMESVGR